MTLVGKILVIVIMAFSLLFLGVSTVVFATAKNWKEATRAEQKKVTDIQSKLKDAQAQKDSAEKGLNDAKVAFDAQTKVLEGRIRSLEDTNKRDLEQIEAVRKEQAVANHNAESALAEVEAKRKETILLRDQKSAVEKQANEYKLQHADLIDKIRELERVNETATKNNANLREAVAKYTTLLQENGLSTDIREIKGRENPPPVVGEVKRVDPTGRRIEMSIGADDGLVVGHELFVFHTKPRAEYLGKVSIISVDPDQAVGRVIGNTFQGKKIKEGDSVSSTIKPRF
jgi:hypothetical protein